MFPQMFVEVLLKVIKTGVRLSASPLKRVKKFQKVFTEQGRLLKGDDMDLISNELAILRMFKQ